MEIIYLVFVSHEYYFEKDMLNVFHDKFNS